jgi:hypothetical protein
MAQTVECLLCKYKTLSSIKEKKKTHNTQKKKSLIVFTSLPGPSSILADFKQIFVENKGCLLTFFWVSFTYLW